MTITARPDLSALEVPIDAWTEPFWQATAEGALRLPRCGACEKFRWPPGPFCPACHSQSVEWMPAGEARVYSFALVPAGVDKQDLVAPALIEFAAAPGVRLPAAIVETPVAAICIGAVARMELSPARNAMVPVFRIEADELTGTAAR